MVKPWAKLETPFAVNRIANVFLFVNYLVI